MTMRLRASIASLLMSALLVGSANAELPSETGHGLQSATLPVPASKRWVWVNDFVFQHMSDGMAYLIDGDSGRYLGTLSTGFGFAHLLLSRDGKLIYSPETYFSRGTRGKRTDVVTLYDPGTLSAIGEIAIPPRRSSNLPMIANDVLTDDDRFLLIYDFTPPQVDHRRRYEARGPGTWSRNPGMCIGLPDDRARFSPSTATARCC